jgi:hypothetical protein
VNTYATLMELANQREAALASLARRACQEPASGTTAPAVPCGSARDSRRLITRLRILATRA